MLARETMNGTLSEAGKALGGTNSPLSRSGIYRLLGTGDLEMFKVGGRTLIAVDSLKRYVDRQRKAA